MFKKILFLDVDGVLNQHSKPGEDGGLDPVKVENLAWLVKKTGCKIVLSSAWRYMGSGPNSVFVQCLYGCLRHNYDRDAISSVIIEAIISKAEIEEVGKPIDRDELIRRWMEVNGVPEVFVVLDDLPCVRSFGDNAVVCNPHCGLRTCDLEKAFKILGGVHGNRRTY